MASAITVATRYQVLLEGVKAHEAKKFARVVNLIGEAVLEWSTKLAVDNGKLTSLKRKQYAKAVERLQTAVEKKLDGVSSDLFASVEKAAASGVRVETETLLRALADFDPKTPTTAKLREAVFSSNLSANGQTLNDFIKGWIEEQPKRIKLYANKAYANGLTIQEMVQGIRGTKANGFKDGLLATTRREAEAVARTSVQHAASSAREEVWKTNRDVVTGYRFIATLDGRTTEICRALDQRTFKLGDGPTPPLHINCRSTTVAVLPKELDFLKTGATRSSKDGYVAADLSYYEWLKRQPAKFQDTVLGDSRGALFRKGGLTADEFAALSLNKDFKPRTLEQMRELEPLAFEKAGL